MTSLDAMIEIASGYTKERIEARLAAMTAAGTSNLSVTDLLRLGAIAHAAGSDAQALRILVEQFCQDLSNGATGDPETPQASRHAAAMRAA